MKREIIITEDGSSSIFIPEMDETYHSTHGSIQEAEHVFLKNGIQRSEGKELSIFEVGFGTGLNALISLIHSSERQKINYHSIEAFPVEEELIQQINYCSILGKEYQVYFDKMHTTEWGREQEITPSFSLLKIHEKLQDYTLIHNSYDIIFFDAFGPNAQAEMWSEAILEEMFKGLKQGAFLTTYCAQGQFKRDLKAVGFKVEAVPGPPGKREMTLAWK